MIYSEYFERLKNKKVAVVGVGVSNTPLIRLLVKYGARVTACDKRDNLGELGGELEKSGVELCLGKEYLEHFDHDIIFKSPGIRDDIPQFVAAVNKGTLLTSEMEVFFELCPAQIFAVTGSDGKTTTTTLIYELLKTQGYNCFLGGNIGNPLLPVIDKISKDDKVIVELSSFQLKTMKKSADVAVITNLAPNHLDWHTGMDEYLESKKNIYSYQNKEGLLVLNNDNAITKELKNEAKGNVMMFSRLDKANVCLEDNYISVNGEKTVDVDEILLPGVHNIENYMAAIGATYKYISKETIKKVASTFAKIPHRIEFIRELNGIKFYNDSIASSPSRAMAGLRSFDKKIIMIAGGYDKKIPFDVMGDVVVERVKKLVLIGATSDKIEKAVTEATTYSKGNPEIVRASSFENSLELALDNAQGGDIIILCPACASFDLFKNFEERGNKFKEMVNKL